MFVRIVIFGYHYQIPVIIAIKTIIAISLWIHCYSHKKTKTKQKPPDRPKRPQGRNWYYYFFLLFYKLNFLLKVERKKKDKASLCLRNIIFPFLLLMMKVVQSYSNSIPKNCKASISHRNDASFCDISSQFIKRKSAEINQKAKKLSKGKDKLRGRRYKR